MVQEILLDDMVFKVLDFELLDEKPLKVSFTFEVNGGKHYHDVTKFLYKNRFDVIIPEKQLV